MTLSLLGLERSDSKVEKLEKILLQGALKKSINIFSYTGKSKM
jgi:hypothetical protein